MFVRVFCHEPKNIAQNVSSRQFFFGRVGGKHEHAQFDCGCSFFMQKGGKMNKKLQKAMELKGDTQQDLANYLGLHSYISIHSKLYGKTGWKKEQVEKVCKRYKKTKEELGLA